jgi:hypothetical protein
VRPARQRSRGSSSITVSTIESGAGSVAVSARPILPKTRRTSGIAFSSRSMRWSTAPAEVIEIPSGATGM